MFGVKNLIDELNEQISSGSLSNLEIAQASNAIELLEQRGVFAVKNFADLPNPATNQGRFVFIDNENRYVVSDGTSWSADNIYKKPYINLWTWGSNNLGQLGFNSTIDRSSPVFVVGGFTDWVSVNAGANHTAALRADGTAWAWGNNSSGRLGNNSTVYQSSPVQVVGGNNWTQISAARFSTFGVQSNGTAWSWGGNFQGQLGVNDTNPRSSPVSVVGGFTDWVEVNSWVYHTTGVRANGTLWMWGANSTGQLGTNNTNARSSPVLVVGDYTDWVHANTGFQHTVGIRANGTAWAWGRNTEGQLGTNDTNARSSPVSVVGGYTDWIQASGSNDNFMIALRANGTLWSWGSGTSGRLGTGDQGQRSSPVSVAGGFTDWVSVSAGTFHAVAVRANGTAWAWGRNTEGLLGDSSVTQRTEPVEVGGNFTDWVAVGAGGFHTAGLRS